MRLTWIKALVQLGFRQTSLYALYQLELKSGYLRWKTKVPAHSTAASFQTSIPLPELEQLRPALGLDGLGFLQKP
jgi:hypothetical protein